MAPFDVGLLHVSECDRKRSGSALTHATVAQIGVMILDQRGVANSPAGAAACHSIGQDHSLGSKALARLRGGMSSVPTPQEIAADARWLAQALDPAAGQVRLIAMDRDSYRAASFLDDRILQQPVEGHIVPWSALEAAAAQIERCDARWIFHIGHVGSTLTSRLLGEIPHVLAVREP